MRLLVDLSEPIRAKQLRQFQVEDPPSPTVPSVLGARLVALLLRDVPSNLVPDLGRVPKAK